MHDQMDVPVAVLSSRPSLDLAINIWMPGYVARSVKDVDAVMDLTDEGGVIVIDLGDPDGPEVLRALHERHTGTPTVVVNVGNRQLDPDIASLVVVADSTSVAELTSALDAARGRGKSRHDLATGKPVESGAETQEAPLASERQAAPPRTTEESAPGMRPEQPPSASQEAAKVAGMRSAQDPTSAAAAVDRARRSRRRSGPVATMRRAWWPSGSRRTPGQGRAGGPGAVANPASPPGLADAPRAETSANDELLFATNGGEPERVIDLTDRSFRRDEAVAAMSPRTGPHDDARLSVDPVVVGRSWIVLDELKGVIESGSAVVAVRASDLSYAIVAGVGIAPLDADRLINVGDPIIDEVRLQGWSRFSRAEPDGIATSPPLADCDEVLAVTVPGDGRELDVVAWIGRFVPFSNEDVRSAVSAVADTKLLDDRLRRLQTPAARAAVVTPGVGPFVATSVARAAWQLLDELFPRLGGAAAAVALECDAEVFVATAAIGVGADVAARFVPADHPLLDRVRERGGMAQVQAANEGYSLVGGLPLPPHPFVVGLRVDAPERRGAVVLIARQSRFTNEELAILRLAINEHRLTELLQLHDG